MIGHIVTSVTSDGIATSHKTQEKKVAGSRKK